MEDFDIRRQRLVICKACEFWAGRCQKLHPGVQSNLGCPVGKFVPLHGAMYANDPKLRIKPPPKPCCEKAVLKKA